MIPRRAPHQELTSEENKNVLATLTNDGWGAMAIARARAEFFDNDIARELLNIAVMSSGSIHGEHRRDIVNAIQGAKPPKVGIALQDMVEFQEAPQANGHAKVRGL